MEQACLSTDNDYPINIGKSSSFIVFFCESSCLILFLDPNFLRTFIHLGKILCGKFYHKFRLIYTFHLCVLQRNSMKQHKRNEYDKYNFINAKKRWIKFHRCFQQEDFHTFKNYYCKIAIEFVINKWKFCAFDFYQKGLSREYS